MGSNRPNRLVDDRGYTMYDLAPRLSGKVRLDAIKVRAFIAASGDSKADIAGRMGLKHRCLGRLTECHKWVARSTAQRLADALGVELDRLTVK